MSVTLKDIAERAGVSLMTVSHAINEGGSLRPETRARIRKIASDLGYRPNAAARSMRRKRNMQIGVVTLDDAAHDFRSTSLYEFQRGINEGLDSAGYLMSVVRLHDVEKPLEDRPLAVRENVLDGVIAVNALPSKDVGRINGLANKVIWLDTAIAEPERCIRRDEYGAGQLAATKAIEAGYDRLVWVHPYDTLLASEMVIYANDRRRGVEDVCARHGLTLGSFLAHSKGEPLDAERYRGCALVCANIYNARYVVARAAVSHARAGIDFGLICADDAFDTDWWFDDLARIRFDRVNMGREAARMMVQLIEEPMRPCPSITVGVEYKPGATLAPRSAG